MDIHENIMMVSMNIKVHQNLLVVLTRLQINQ